MKRKISGLTWVPQKSSSIIILLIFLFVLNGNAQGDSSCIGYPNIGQKKLLVAIGGSPGTPRYESLLQYTPKGYNPADFTTTYPVIIYFPGYGTASGLPPFGIDPCRLIYDQPTSLPGKIAENKFRDSVFADGKWQHYIVLSFQYNTYNYPTDFPSSASVDSLIDYVLATYRVNPARIYLTGMSSGANIVVQYGGSTIARAQRVAAISIASTCSQVGIFPNGSNAGANIASGKLATRFISCTTDGTCQHTYSQTWVSDINANSPNPPAELITLDGSSGTFACEGFEHNSWNKLYDTSFRFNGTNLFEWNIQFARNAAVPVLLQNFSARLNKGKVLLLWTTFQEIDAASYLVERAGPDLRFTKLITIKARGNTNQVSNYNFIDETPLVGLNYYRLVQNDADNNRHYFETRKIMNARNNKTTVLVLPNPVLEEVTAFININRAQRVSLSITDMNGKVLKNKTSFLAEGNTGVTMHTRELAKGIYFLQVSGEDFKDVQKIIKQ